MTESTSPRPLRSRHWNIILHEPQVPGHPWVVSLVSNHWFDSQRPFPELESREYVPESQVGAHVRRLLAGVQPRLVEQPELPF